MKIRIKSPPCTGCVWGQREDDELIYCFRADVCARIREQLERRQENERGGLKCFIRSMRGIV